MSCSDYFYFYLNEYAEKVLRITSVILAFGLTGVAFALVLVGGRVDDALFNFSTFIIPEEFANSSRACILMGMSLFGIVALQMSGTLRRWCFLMTMNTALLGYLVLMSIFVIKYTGYDSQGFKTQLFYGLLVSLKRFGENSDNGKEFRMGWTRLQISKHCCGTNNYTDWLGAKHIQHEPIVPISCCRKLKVAFCTDKVNFQNATEDSQYIYTQGCYEKSISDANVQELSVVLFVFFIFGLLSTLNSGYLAWKWRRRDRDEPIVL